MRHTTSTSPKTTLSSFYEWIRTKHQLFQFNGSLNKQIDGVAMGSPLGPFMANTFMCTIEEKLESEDKLPSFYKRYVDDTLAVVSKRVWYSDCHGFAGNIKRGTPSNQLHDGRIKQQQAIFHRNGAYKDWKTLRNFFKLVCHILVWKAFVSTGKQQIRAFFFTHGFFFVMLMPATNDPF